MFTKVWLVRHRDGSSCTPTAFCRRCASLFHTIGGTDGTQENEQQHVET